MDNLIIETLEITAKELVNIILPINRHSEMEQKYWVEDFIKDFQEKYEDLFYDQKYSELNNGWSLK